MTSLVSALRPEAAIVTNEIGPGSVVQTVSLSFPLWVGPFLTMAEDCNKRRGRVVGANGDLSCAEVEIVRRLRDAGWSAFWVSEFRVRRAALGLESVPGSVLPPAVRELEARIGMGKQGRPDVVAWRGDTIGYVESKGPGDKLKSTQIDWFRKAREVGASPDDLVVVTWRPRA